MNNIFRFYVRFFVLTFPLFFLPVIVDGFGVGKNWWLVASALVGLLIWVLDLIVGKKEKISWNKALSFGLVAVIWALVTFLRETLGVRVNSLLNPLGMGGVAGLFIWAFLWLQVRKEGEAKIQLNWLSAAGILVAVTSILAFMIPEGKLPFNFPQDNPLISISGGWSITGSLMAELILMLFLASEWIKRLVEKIKDKRNDYVVEGIVAGVFVLVGLLDVFKIVKLGWVTLDGLSAWIIAVETFKISPIFGAGIGNFSQAFELYRPATYNLTSVWSNGFSISSMGILHIWTETGLVGILLTLFGISQLLKSKKNFDFWRGLGLAAAVLLLPLNFMAIFLLVWLVINRIGEKAELPFGWKINLKSNSSDSLETGARVNVVPWITLLLLGGLVTVAGGWWVGFLRGEIFFRNSLLAASKNDGTNTYNLQIKAIAANPYSGEFRRVYSQTNMALASAILSNKDVADADKEKASTLIQQAVREGKAAIALNDLSATYWANLAAIYKSLIGLVEGSADWSLQAYQQAAAFDANNPLIKLDMGGLLFAAQRYEEAERVFEQAVTVKSDYANAWYNWAYSAKQQNKLYDAVQRLNQAVALVPADSGDYEKASKELDTWKKELEEAIKKQEALNKEAEKQAKEAETLKTPEALPTVGEEEKVDVSAADLEPPEAPVTDVLPEKENPTPTTGAVSQPTGNP